MECPRPLGPRFSAALALAAELHGSQVRKGSGIPYVAHLLAVTALVIEHGGDEDQAIAAALHDAVEDQGGAEMLQRIDERFGPRVAAIVQACTDAETIPKPPWRARKEAYIVSLEHKPPEALLVSLADKVHNARSILADYERIGEALWERFAGGRDGTLWYYRELSRFFTRRGHPHLAADLEAVVQRLHVLADCGSGE
jgi:GTP pyrophosphokinase